jgi:hypothetical protein
MTTVRRRDGSRRSPYLSSRLAPGSPCQGGLGERGKAAPPGPLDYREVLSRVDNMDHTVSSLCRRAGYLTRVRQSHRRSTTGSKHQQWLQRQLRNLERTEAGGEGPKAAPLRRRRRPSSSSSSSSSSSGGEVDGSCSTVCTELSFRQRNGEITHPQQSPTEGSVEDVAELCAERNWVRSRVSSPERGVVEGDNTCVGSLTRRSSAEASGGTNSFAQRESSHRCKSTQLKGGEWMNEAAQHSAVRAAPLTLPLSTPNLPQTTVGSSPVASWRPPDKECQPPSMQSSIDKLAQLPFTQLGPTGGLIPEGSAGGLPPVHVQPYPCTPSSNYRPMHAKYGAAFLLQGGLCAPT